MQLMQFYMPACKKNFLPINLVGYFILLSACHKTDSQNPENMHKANPNIVLILGDDVGYEVPSCNGGESYSTTAIDNLALSGIRFTQCHACANCSPTRVELFTGKYNFRNYTGWGSLSATQKTIANMLHDAGYKTCVAGKWQLDGGDMSIRKFGFDKYRVFQPFYLERENIENKYRYKNPRLYENGSYLPDNVTQGKYADDLFADYISNFIDSNVSNPFFIYFPLSLCHAPFSPTPDDAEYSSWDPLVNQSDQKFFPSMVKYMDKKVQQIIDKINAAGLSHNTIIIYMGDNGTSIQITSKYNGEMLQGGKATSTIYGTHVPLIITWPGTISPQQTSDALIALTDFLPAFADVANIKKPADYGILDGISFYPVLFGSKMRLRDWIYFYWYPQNSENPIFRVWVQDESYKLYDGTYQHFFFNTVNDPYELSPILNDELKEFESQRKSVFDSVLTVMHN